MDTLSSGSNTAPGITYDDLRQWLVQADRLGEVRVVKGATWQKDIGMAAEAILREDDSPCVVFEDIPGVPKGFRLLMNVFAGKRRNMTLGFADHLNKTELSEAYYDTYLREPKTIPHKIVESGPVLENVLTGDAIDVTRFPAPVWHPDDGGRYIGTGTYSVTMDPEEKWYNCGAYRAMVHDKNSVGCLMVPGKHGHIHREKYFARGEPLPIVMVIGGDPLAFFFGGFEAPYGVCELDIIGGLRGHAVECVKGKFTGLPFPAHAEIVLEGYVHPDKRKVEGPFGEWTGYYAGGASACHVLDIKAIYHRNDPIILGCPPMGAGPDEMARYRSVLRSAMLKRNLQDAGVPDIQQVWCHETGATRMLHGISIKQRYPGHAMQVGHLAATVRSSAYAGKLIIVVDDDIDVSNLEQLIWAMVTRMDPAKSVDILHNIWSSPADPRIEPEQRAAGNITNARMVIDATRPFHWRDKFPPVNFPGVEAVREAKEKFGWLMDKP